MSKKVEQQAVECPCARWDRALRGWMYRNGLTSLRWSMGVIFIWFGTLKFFPGMSPAEGLVVDTIRIITFGLVPDAAMRILLAMWEVLIGVGFLYNRYMRVTLMLLFAQMAGTFTPLIFFPDLCFQRVPLVLTMEGQYIIKNVVLIAAGMVVGGFLSDEFSSAVRTPSEALRD